MSELSDVYELVEIKTGRVLARRSELQNSGIYLAAILHEIQTGERHFEVRLALAEEGNDASCDAGE